MPAKGTKSVKNLAQRLETLTVEWASPADLRPNPWNPNRQNEHEFLMLCKSIEDAGFTQPIMVTQISKDHEAEWATEVESGRFTWGDLVIVDGEHRWRAAQHLAIDPIPFVKMPYGAMQARLSTLQMNRARGSEDMELATDMLRDFETLGILDWAAESLDMGDDELQALLDDVPAPDALAADEFGEAWHPAGTRVDDGPIVDGVTSHTPRALAEDRAFQRKQLSVETEEERQKVRWDRTTYQVMLRFTGDESDLVRSVLAVEPATKILAWSREKMGANGAESQDQAQGE